MIKRIKEYFEYRKNKKIAKRELARMTATTLPAIREFTGKGTEILKFVQKLVESTKSTNKEELFPIVINEVAKLLGTTQPRLIEILQYMTSLSPEEMQKILFHSIVETMPNKDNK